MKRPFERKDGFLIDREDPDHPRTWVEPAWMNGEAPTKEERQDLIEKIKDPDAVQVPYAELALGKNLPEDLVDTYLARLSEGDPGAAWSMASQYSEDPRVPPAIIEAGRKAELQNLAGYSQAAGQIGGAEARAFLSEKLQELRENSATYDDDDFFNDLAGALETTARSLLELQADSPEAAEALVSLLDHPCPFNRRRAASAIGKFLLPLVCSRTSASITLFRGLARISDTSDDEQFLFAFPGLMVCHTHLKIDWEAAWDRCESLLQSDSQEIRSAARHALTSVPYCKAYARSVLLQWLPVAPTLSEQVEVASTISNDVPEPILRGIVRKALAAGSPEIRRSGISLLNCLRYRNAVECAKEALVDEPDPLLKDKLFRFVGE